MASGFPEPPSVFMARPKSRTVPSLKSLLLALLWHEIKMEPSRRAPNAQHTLVEPLGSGANSPLPWGWGRLEQIPSCLNLPGSPSLEQGHPAAALADRAQPPRQLTQSLEELVEILAAAHLPGTGEVGHGGGGAKAAAGTHLCCGAAARGGVAQSDWRSAPSRTRLESPG